MDIFEDALSAHRPQGFLAHYPVELFHGAAPRLDRGQLETALAERAPELEMTYLDDGKIELQLRQPLEGMSPRWTVTRTARRIDPEAFFRVVEQSWAFPEGVELLSRVNHVLRVRDDDIHGIDHRQRIEAMQRLCAALLDATGDHAPALALHWAPTQQLLHPEISLQAWIEDEFTSPMPGAINVRFYRVENDDGDVPGEVDFLMDTLGLCAVGLHDLQCHFRGLDPDGVGPVLYTAALYQWDKGPVLQNGHTVQGLRDDDEWLCQHEVSIAPPERDVVDFDPGFPFAAGVSGEDSSS